MRVSIDEVKQSLFTAAEVHAAFKMSLLVKVFGPSSAAFLSCYSSGVNKRIIPSKKILWVFAIISALGPQLAWKVLLFWHHYYRVELPISPALCLNLNMLTDSECKEKFRFSHRHIQLLVSRLGFPDMIIVQHHKDRILAVEAFCLLLRRLSYPNRWCDLRDSFGRHASAMSRIFNYVMHFMLQRIKVSLLSYPMNADRLLEYATAFEEKGVPNTLRLFGVIDTKKHLVCKPGQNQRALYSGHKRVHCVKYQRLEAPDRLILHCTPCFDGRRGDGYILRRSQLLNFLRRHPLFLGFVILGDSAYPNNDVMVSIYKGRHFPELAEAFNSIMCPIRTCVEWGYDKIVCYWAFVDFKKQMKVQHVRVEAMWHIAVFLTNAITCAKGGNQISKYFNLSPPSMEQFLDNTMAAYYNYINN